MSHRTTMMCGVILLIVPSIQYGGYFLLQLLSGRHDNLQLNDFQKSMFRAGHAHAGVLVILSLIAEILTDHANLPGMFIWISRIGFPLAAILVSAGFFAGSCYYQTHQANRNFIRRSCCIIYSAGRTWNRIDTK